MTDTPALEMEGVRKTYQVGDQEVVALDHADLTIGRDEIVALVGPSGSGKTTLCSIAGGLLTPTEGKVLLGGDDISGLLGQASSPTCGAPGSASCSRASTWSRS